MKNRLAELIATGLGSGYAPFAPATAGSAAALLIYWALPFGGAGDSPWLFALIAGTVLAGTWAAQKIITPRGKRAGRTGIPSPSTGDGQGEGAKHDTDPKRCVIDEFAGVWVTCLFLPATWAWLLAAFITFRVLDIAKPLGIRRLEKLPGGIGIMADDLAAGVVGAVALNAVRLVFFD